jgi:hypothetical protein
MPRAAPVIRMFFPLRRLGSMSSSIFGLVCSEQGLLRPAWAFCNAVARRSIPRSMSCSSSPQIWMISPISGSAGVARIEARRARTSGRRPRRSAMQAPHFGVGADRVARIGAAAVLDVELLRSRRGEDDSAFRGGPIRSGAGWPECPSHSRPPARPVWPGARAGCGRKPVLPCAGDAVELEIGRKQCVAIGHGDLPAA